MRLSDKLKSFKEWLHFQRLHLRLLNRWSRSIRELGALTPRPQLRKLLFATGDPWTLRGSKGDEAVMRTVAARLRQESPDLEIVIFSATPAASEAARQLGYRPIETWKHFWDPLAVSVQLREEAPDALVILGADVMDGYYSYLVSLQLLQLADIASRQGVRTTILGFSFNESPDPRLKSAFERVTTRLTMNLRDPISLERFQKFCKAPARLVADPAFFLQPDRSQTPVAEIIAWMAARQAAGDQVLVYNYHPMLFQGCPPDKVQPMISATIQALQELLTKRPLSVVLLSHDYRDADGDDVCLQPVHEALVGVFGERLLYPRNKMASGELKAVAAASDGVVAGRMHLAIASLGSGVPVLGLVYQSKFQGLFAHFQLPEDLLVEPEDSLDAKFLEQRLGSFLDRIVPLTQDIRSRLPGVLEMSRLNFEPIVGSL